MKRWMKVVGLLLVSLFLVGYVFRLSVNWSDQHEGRIFWAETRVLGAGKTDTLKASDGTVYYAMYRVDLRMHAPYGEHDTPTCSLWVGNETAWTDSIVLYDPGYFNCWFMAEFPPDYKFVMIRNLTNDNYDLTWWGLFDE